MLKDDGKDVYEDNDDSKNLDLVERSGGEESEDEFENDLALVIHGNSTCYLYKPIPGKYLITAWVSNLSQISFLHSSSFRIYL